MAEWGRAAVNKEGEKDKELENGALISRVILKKERPPVETDL